MWRRGPGRWLPTSRLREQPPVSLPYLRFPLFPSPPLPTSLYVDGQTTHSFSAFHASFLGSKESKALEPTTHRGIACTQSKPPRFQLIRFIVPSSLHHSPIIPLYTPTHLHAYWCHPHVLRRSYINISSGKIDKTDHLYDRDTWWSTHLTFLVP